jgi:thiol-disulfide isomerase/thioredoxin
MARTPSTMLPLGTPAPVFNLFDVHSEQYKSLLKLKSSIATVIMFICNHCPFVIHIKEKLIERIIQYQKQQVSFIAICSNDVANYPDDSPAKMKLEGYPCPYLYDETQEVAKAYNAACTPDFYIFDKDLLLVYRGQFDDSRPGNSISVTGDDLCNAIDAIINQNIIDTNQQPSLGCNIKWKT